MEFSQCSEISVEISRNCEFDFENSSDFGLDFKSKWSKLYNLQVNSQGICEEVTSQNIS